MKLIAKTLFGAEELLSEELKSLGATEVEVQRRAVSCSADKKTLYKICYQSRLAIRVMILLSEFKADNENELYKGVRSIEWNTIIPQGKTVFIDYISFSQNIDNTSYVAQTVYDAISDQMLTVEERCPRSDNDNPDLLINVHVTDERVAVSVDAVGASLNRRGYRSDNIEVATNEVLAAILVDLSGWKPTQALVDPMCGAGTICIEAAMKARRIPAAKYRRYAFGFENMSDFDSALWESVKNEADSQINHIKLNIVGSDIDTDAIDLAKTTILENKEHFSDIRISRCSIKEQTRMTQEGVVLTCPPYNADETRRGLNDFYKEITYHLSHNFPDFDVWIYSPAREALDNIEFQAAEDIRISDGSLRLYPF